MPRLVRSHSSAPNPWHVPCRSEPAHTQQLESPDSGTSLLGANQGVGGGWPENLVWGLGAPLGTRRTSTGPLREGPHILLPIPTRSPPHSASHPRSPCPAAPQARRHSDQGPGVPLEQRRCRLRPDRGLHQLLGKARAGARSSSRWAAAAAVLFNPSRPLAAGPQTKIEMGQGHSGHANDCCWGAGDICPPNRACPADKMNKDAACTCKEGRSGPFCTACRSGKLG